MHSLWYLHTTSSKPFQKLSNKEPDIISKATEIHLQEQHHQEWFQGHVALLHQQKKLAGWE